MMLDMAARKKRGFSRSKKRIEEATFSLFHPPERPKIKQEKRAWQGPNRFGHEPHAKKKNNKHVSLKPRGILTYHTYANVVTIQKTRPKRLFVPTPSHRFHVHRVQGE